MAANFVKTTGTVTLIAPSGGVVSGTGYVIGSLFVVALVTAAAGAPFAARQDGVFRMTKATHATTKAFTAGEAIFWDNTNKVWDKTGAGLFQIGVAIEAAASTSNVVLVEINQRALAAV